MRNDFRTLITLPDLNGPGGVAHYYRAVLPKLPQTVESLVIGTNYSAKGPPGPIRLVLDIIAFTKRFWRYDLIHLNPSLCARCFFRELILIAIAKVVRRKVVVFFRGWEKAFEQKVNRRWKWLFRLVYCRADAIIVLAEEFEVALRRWGYKGRVYRETTTVDEQLLEGFDPFSRVQSSEAFHVLFLARVEKDKGVYEAVDAVAKLAKPNVKFVIAGDGGERSRLEQYVAEKKYSGIELCGYVRGDQKIAAYIQADAFLFPSYYGEGMPNSVLEAMAFGLPIITCPTGGLKDFFEDGDMGALIEPRGADVIKNALSMLLEDPLRWARISQHNARYAQEHFYSARVAERLQKIYADTMDKGEQA